VWWIGCVENEEVANKPQSQQVRFATKVQNKYDCLTDAADDEEDEASKCNDCISWPVVGKGGEVNKMVLGKGNLGKRENIKSSRSLTLPQRLGKSSSLELWRMNGQGGQQWV
jgi:hypothetical protein